VWQIGGTEFATIAVVDDEEASRESLGWLLSDADLNMHALAGPLTSVETAREEIVGNAHALICDHHLAVRNYAHFDGAELVASTIRGGFPAILCTRYQGADIDSIRPLLPDIPVVLRWDEMDEPEELLRALNDCTAELAGMVAPERKVWRAQVVVERVDQDDQTFDVSVPAWELEESVRLRLPDLPSAIQPSIQVGFRAHAMVNLGATVADRLFVTGWEY